MKKVAIIDFDVHHGNGTEAIFSGNPRILYVSLHQSPLYPMTGLQSNENARNYPLKPGTGDEAYLKAFEKALKDVEAFGPNYIAISAGFDASGKEKIAQLRLNDETFRKIGGMIAGLGRPGFAVLEGGYVDIEFRVLEFLKGWSGE
jgi:acetoin utilization deacetylase AcuC-like enzyme